VTTVANMAERESIKRAVRALCALAEEVYADLGDMALRAPATEARLLVNQSAEIHGRVCALKVAEKAVRS